MARVGRLGPKNLGNDLRFLAACLILSAAAALAIIVRRSHPVVSFGLIALLASPLTAYVFMPLADVVAEHRVYIAGLGIALLAAWFASLKPRQGAVVLTGAVLVLSLVTFERNGVWASSETLWRDAARKSPRLARLYVNLGVALQSDGRYDEALAEYEHALSVYPGLALVYSNISSIWLQKEDLDGAETLLNKAVELSPGRVGAYVNLAGIKLMRHQPDEALQILDQAAKFGNTAALEQRRGEALAAAGRPR